MKAKFMLEVEKLIDNKMMMVDAENYHVSILEELWNMYYDEGKTHLCRNIRNYCAVKNSYNQKADKFNHTLLISIKDKDNNVAPFAYFKDDRVQLIDNSQIMRDPVKRIYWPFAKRMIKVVAVVGLVVASVVAVVYYFG
jgi:hypothetical protein